MPPDGRPVPNPAPRCARPSWSTQSSGPFAGLGVQVPRTWCCPRVGACSCWRTGAGTRQSAIYTPCTPQCLPRSARCASGALGPALREPSEQPPATSCQPPSQWLAQGLPGPPLNVAAQGSLRRCHDTRVRMKSPLPRPPRPTCTPRESSADAATPAGSDPPPPPLSLFSRVASPPRQAPPRPHRVTWRTFTYENGNSPMPPAGIH